MGSKIQKVIGLIILGAAIIFASGYMYLSVMGQAILTNQLQEATRKKVSIGYFFISPTLRVDVKDLNIQGLVKSQQVSVSLSFSGLLRGKLILNQLLFIKPEFFVNKVPPEVTKFPVPTEVIAPPEAVDVLPKELKPAPFGIVSLNIKEGKLTFVDQTVKSGSIKITVEGIDASIKNIYLYPFSGVTEFKLKAEIPWRDNEESGKIELEGWINPFKKDMQATLKVNDIDAVYLYPYYSNWVDLDKARIERAKLNFSSEIHGLNNDVTADCFLELSDMVRKPLEIGEMEAKASKLTNAVLDRFKAQDEGSVKLKFTIRTRMDSPQFGFDNFKAAFEEKLMKGRSTSRFSLQDAMAIPVKTVESGVRSFTDLSRAMIDGVFAIGNEIKRSTEGMLKQQNDSQDNND
ncbi:MAG: DUF748 domain-containing protein [Candidatus Omnitrophota bacterium]|jgi:hypothetical protein